MTSQRKVALALVVAVAVVTAITFIVAYAVPKDLEAETGTIAGEAAVMYDASASSGSAIKFGASTPTIPTIPTAATVGPRCDESATVISPSQALTTLRSTGYLSCVTIGGMLSLEGSDGVDWLIEDVRINSGSLYSLSAYRSGDAFTGTYAQRPVFRYVDLVGRGAYSTGSCNAVIAANDVVIEYADIYGCSDGVKTWDNVSLRYSWVHDMDHPSGAHSDAVQIVRGVNTEFYANRFDAYVGYSSDGSLVPDGSTGNSVLQTGSCNGDVQATWTNNWFAGGHYTIRGGATCPSSDDVTVYDVDYSFVNNRFLRYGTSVALGLTNLEPYRYGQTYGGVETSQVWTNNVWDDTGDPVP